MKRAFVPVGAVLTVALIVLGCSSGPSPSPSLGATTAPSVSATAAATVAQPTGSPQMSDADQAAALVDAYVKALIAGQWQTAWDMLSPNSTTRQLTFADYSSERSAFFKGVAGKYTVAAPANDAATMAQWASTPALTQGAVMTRAYVVQVTYPNVAGNANFEIYLAAPDASGAWRLWDLR